MIRFSKTSWICTIIVVLLIVAMFALNAYVLDLTHGCYSAFDILFM